MLKQVVLCICDICGKSEPAKLAYKEGRGGVASLPNGWTPAWGNKQVHICPECNEKLRIGYKEGRV